MTDNTSSRTSYSLAQLLKLIHTHWHTLSICLFVYIPVRTPWSVRFFSVVVVTVDCHLLLLILHSYANEIRLASILSESW